MKTIANNNERSNNVSYVTMTDLSPLHSINNNMSYRYVNLRKFWYDILLLTLFYKTDIYFYPPMFEHLIFNSF